MSLLTYSVFLSPKDKPLVWLHGEIKTPPMSPAARLEAGYLLRQVQRGEVFAKKTGKTPKSVIATCRNRMKEYEDAGK